MPDYSKSKIYKLVHEDKYYIGSTTLLLCRRLAGHKQNAKKQINQKCYNYFNNINWDNVKIILIENYPCKSKEELLAKEDEYIRKYLTDDKCLNKNKATQSYEEFLEYNKLRRRVKIDKRYKVTDDIKNNIIIDRNNGMLVKDIAKKYNLNRNTISKITLIE